MGTYGAYQTDKDLETNGVLLDLGEQGAFVVARAGGANRKYLTEVRKLTQKYRRQIIAGTLDPDIAERLAKEAFSKTIVLRWLKKGDKFGSFEAQFDVTGPNGSPLPFNVENCKMLLTDLHDLYLDIKDCADSSTAYRKEVVVEEGKSSAKS